MTPVSPTVEPAAAKNDPSISDHTEQANLPVPSVRVRCFTVADRWFHRLANLGSALHRGFWLGCLNPDDFNAVTMKRYAGSQTLASVEHLQSGLFDWEATLVHRYFPKGSRILVAAAGSGREILALRKEGFDAEGFECNPNLVRVGRKMFEQLGEAYPVTFCPADMVPPGQQIYDGLIVGWSGYMHIPTKKRRTQFLEAMRNRSRPRSPLLLSFFTRTISSRCDLITYHTAKICRIIFRAAKEGAVELGDDLDASYYVHRFTRDELQGELKAAGFEMVHYNDEFRSGVAVALAD